jgi:type II secretory pathway component PulK
MVAIQTRFFEVLATLELEGQPLHEIALMQRDGQRVKIVRRQRSARPRIQMP